MVISGGIYISLYYIVYTITTITFAISDTFARSDTFTSSDTFAIF